MKSVLIINNDSQRQAEIVKALESSSTHVVCATTVHSALQLFMKQEFTLVILDTGLSECDGYRLLEVMQAAKPIPILVLSAEVNANNKHHTSFVQSTHFGDAPCDLSDSLELAQELMFENSKSRSKGEICYTLAFGKDLVIDSDKRQVMLKGQKIDLTRKEFDLLFCLASNPGRVFSREQLFGHLWEDDAIFSIDEVVKTHIKTLRKKLSEADRKYIKNVWGVGYIFEHEDD